VYEQEVGQCLRCFRISSVQQRLAPQDISQATDEGENPPSSVARLMLVRPVQGASAFLMTRTGFEPVLPP
jgi:hypothetical protein